MLDGGLVSSKDEPILSSGDVVTLSTYVRLADSFSAPRGMSFMSVRQEWS